MRVGPLPHRSPEQCAKCFLQLSRRCGVAASSSLPRGRGGRRRRDIGVLNEEVKRPYECTLPVVLLYRPTITPGTSLYLHLKAKERKKKCFISASCPRVQQKTFSHFPATFFLSRLRRWHLLTRPYLHPTSFKIGRWKKQKMAAAAFRFPEKKDSCISFAVHYSSSGRRDRDKIGAPSSPSLPAGPVPSRCSVSAPHANTTDDASSLFILVQ